MIQRQHAPGAAGGQSDERGLYQRPLSAIHAVYLQRFSPIGGLVSEQRLGAAASMVQALRGPVWPTSLEKSGLR